MQAPISLCIIVKNEPLLESCLQSLRPYVKEIVVVDTGSTDDTPTVARKYADIFEVYTECNDPETGLIEDFAQARQRSYDLATQPWVMWCDADDIVTGGEHLLSLTEEFEKNKNDLESIVYLFCYEYAYNELKQCILSHFRERLIYNKDKYHWVNPVHEVLVPNENVRTSFVQQEKVVFKHQRQYSNKPQEPGRNLRILRKYFDKVGETDARQLYYLGLEYSNAGYVDESIKCLTRYVEISGWEDERVMACIKLSEVYSNLGKYDEVIKWGFKAIEIKENWSEGYLILAKAFYHIANQGGPNALRNWHRCAHFAKTGLALPPTQTLLFINPMERNVEIHKYLNIALNNLGDIQGALDSVNTGLKSQPDEGNLLNNKRLYQSFLARRDATHAANMLKDVGVLSEREVADIVAILHNQPISSKPAQNTNESLVDKWNIPSIYDLDELPSSVSDDKLQSLIIMVWKQYILRDQITQALSFLDSIVEYMNDSDLVQSALELTKFYASAAAKEKEVLDIVFFAGDGVEFWNPETVKVNGIGGSELMLLELSKRLAALGHKVRIYNSCGENGEGIYDGVEYQQTSKFHDLECDVLVVSRRADMLGDQYNVQAKLKLLWVHDVCAIAATNEILLKADRILALSNWHKENIIRVHNVHPDHVLTTRNGIDAKRFEKTVSRNKYKCVNSSSPDRSWPILLEVWPQIKSRVPDAELHLYYGFKNWEFAAQTHQGQMDLINFLKNKIKEMAPLGVVYHDRINQDELAEEFLSAGCWIHPTWFTETSCITAMEAQAAGLHIVTSSIAALNETVGSRGVLIDGDWTTASYKEQFVNHVVDAMTKDNEEQRVKLHKYAKYNFSLDRLGRHWERMFFNLLKEVESNPLVPYQPTIPYRENGRGYVDGDTRIRVG